MKISFVVEMILIALLIIIGITYLRLMYQAAPSTPVQQTTPGGDTATSASPRLPPPGTLPQ